MSQHASFDASDSSDQSRKKLMLGLACGLIALAAVLYFWRSRGEPPTVLAPAAALPVSDGYTMLCGGCRSSFEIKRDQFGSWPKDDVGAYKCPKCGSANTMPDNSKVTPMVEVPGGG